MTSQAMLLRQEINRHGRFLVASALAFLGLAATPGLASASFHLDKIREVYPGTMAAPNSQYVELQMPVAGENLLHFGQMAYYDASGH